MNPICGVLWIVSPRHWSASTTSFSLTPLDALYVLLIDSLRLLVVLLFYQPQNSQLWAVFNTGVLLPASCVLFDLFNSCTGVSLWHTLFLCPYHHIISYDRCYISHRGNENVTLTLSWNVISNAGGLPRVRGIGSTQVKLPNTYVQTGSNRF